MRARPLLWFVVAAALASPAAIGLHGAQDPQQPTFRTEANYVRVDVYPSSNGAPVTDLQKDDFEILEDGAPQTIDAFEHVMVAGSVPQDEQARAGQPSPNRARCSRIREPASSSSSSTTTTSTSAARVPCATRSSTRSIGSSGPRISSR